MTRATAGPVVFAGIACLIPATVHAHALASTPYFLPVPFWMYVYGCAATLIVTFGVLGFFWGAPGVATGVATRDVAPGRVLGFPRWGLGLLRVGAVGCLVVTIAAGLIGTTDPNLNINMTLFWVVFLLGFAYLTFFIGDLYALINPWKVIVEWLQRAGLPFSTPRVKYAETLGYWPAFVLYVALIWLELFVLPRPSALSIALVVYTAITVAGVFVLGKDIWFRRCDVFSLFFRVIATLAPVAYVPADDGKTWRIRSRPPFAAALNLQPEEEIGLVVFVLFMLSSTTYDAIHQTALWYGWFWRPMLTLLQPVWGDDLGKAQRLLENWFLVYQHAGLLLSPFFYLAVYLLALWWARATTRVTITMRRLAAAFTYSLIPIALAYHVTHYYPMLIIEGQDLVRRLSDPLGAGWNLLNLRPQPFQLPELQVGVVWHTQVALILVGHLISVYLAHVIALRTFPTRAGVIVSQLPLLLLMVVLTGVGLWVLSLPLAG